MAAALPPPAATTTKLPPRLEFARSVAVDVVALGGAGLLIYGSWLAYSPAGFIVAGVLALGAGINGARR